MAGRSANISSPEVIRQFRARFIFFDSECRKELEGVRADVHRVLDWLQREQTAYWKSELRKREEAAENAKRAYKFVAYTTGPLKKDHPEDERLAMMKAIRRKEEAEDKLKAIKRWTLEINHSVIKNLKPCEVLASRLTALTPKVIHRLDQMLDNLDIYMNPLPSGAAVQNTKTAKGDK
jgi:hypothetical protein